MRRRVGWIAVVLFAGCVASPVPGTTPSPTAPNPAGISLETQPPSGALSDQPPFPSPTASSPVGLAPTATPSAPPTPRPTPKPTSSPSPRPPSTPRPTPKSTPKPAFLVAWLHGVGYTMGVSSPIATGDDARVEIGNGAGPTCSVKVHYPSGQSATGLAAHKFTKQSHWVWTWRIPASAGLGTATVKTTCTYGGLAKSGPGSFEIVAPTP